MVHRPAQGTLKFAVILLLAVMIPSQIVGFLAGTDAAMAVGAGGDKQRRIVGIDGIEMDAQRDHAVEQGLRWGDMVQARLYGPGTKASCFYPFAQPSKSDRKRHVLHVGFG